MVFQHSVYCRTVPKGTGYPHSAPHYSSPHLDCAPAFAAPTPPRHHGIMLHSEHSTRAGEMEREAFDWHCNLLWLDWNTSTAKRRLSDSTEGSVSSLCRRCGESQGAGGRGGVDRWREVLRLKKDKESNERQHASLLFAQRSSHEMLPDQRSRGVSLDK